MGYSKEINIIIVDNSKSFCDILNDYLLIQEDIKVTGIAHNGIDALKLIQEKKPDVVLLNIIMPYLDGLGVLKKLKKFEIDSMPVIIILSSISEEKIIKKALALGASRYIIKPFELDFFIKAIRQVFDNASHKTKDLIGL